MVVFNDIRLFGICIVSDLQIWFKFILANLWIVVANFKVSRRIKKIFSFVQFILENLLTLGRWDVLTGTHHHLGYIFDWKAFLCCELHQLINWWIVETDIDFHVAKSRQLIRLLHYMLGPLSLRITFLNGITKFL